MPRTMTVPTFLKYEPGPPRLFLLPPPDQRPKSDPPPWVIAIATTRSATSSCTPLARNLPSCCCHIHQCDQKSTPPHTGVNLLTNFQNGGGYLALTKDKITAATRGWNGVARYCYCHIDELEGVVFEPGGLGVGTPPTLLLPPYPPLAREIEPPLQGGSPRRWGPSWRRRGDGGGGSHAAQ